MDDLAKKALLPAGLQDLLPPDAAVEAAVAERLLACFARFGYERVKPPLVEFEEGLLDGTGAGLANQTFRLMDPVSQRMMAVRSDMTPQVARIAATRLSRSPRPLRLSYAGDILRVRGSELRPERQFGQVGIEMIGASAPAGDAEVILLAVEALKSLDVSGLAVDLNSPTLVTAVLDALALEDAARARLRQALDRTEAAEVAALGGPAADLLGGLVAATGPVGSALGALAGLDLPTAAQGAAETLAAVARIVHEAAPDIILTVDPVEQRGFEYQTGVSFTVFARGVRGELGRGGGYPVGFEARRAGPAEAAVGCTLYLDSLLRALPRGERGRRIFLPAGTAWAAGDSLRADGWITVAGLAPVDDAVAEAGRLDCSHLWAGGRVQPADGQV